MDVRAIITEALGRANIVPRRQAAPGVQVQIALDLLQGIVSTYNNDSYLSFTQDMVDLPASATIHIYGKDDTYGGEYNYYFKTASAMTDNPPDDEDFDNEAWAMVTSDTSKVYVAYNMGEAYGWTELPDIDEFDPRYQQMVRYARAYHAKIKDVVKLNTLMVGTDGYEPGRVKMGFVPPDDFDRYPNNDLAWTWTRLAEGEWVIRTKPRCSAHSGVRYRLSYNKALRFDLDTDLRIPDAYIELLIVALTYKLAVKYPRLDEAQMARLEKELGTMESNVRTPKADQRDTRRDTTDFTGKMSFAGVVGGSMFY